MIAALTSLGTILDISGIRALRRPCRALPHQHPLRESIHYGSLTNDDGIVLNEALLDQPSSWYESPETLAIDVSRSIREGRIVAVKARR